MAYESVSQTAKRWYISERSVRNYCASNRIPGAFQTGKTWNIPDTAKKPARAKRKSTAPAGLLEVLKREKSSQLSGGVYHKVQIEFTSHSSRMEGSWLSHDQIRYMYEISTLGFEDGPVNADDVAEAANHFSCINMIIDQAGYPLSERFIKHLHAVLKNGTSDSRKEWFAVGDYKKVANTVGDPETASSQETAKKMRKLLHDYNRTKSKTLDEILDFHCRFESVHPFPDGNGRIGRLILFKECLQNQIVPFIITDDLKSCYFRDLNEWPSKRDYLRTICLCAQNTFKRYLDYFQIPYRE
jgi:Fic family protein